MPAFEKVLHAVGKGGVGQPVRNTGAHQQELTRPAVCQECVDIYDYHSGEPLRPTVFRKSSGSRNSACAPALIMS